MAHDDPLADLPNRVPFRNRLKATSALVSLEDARITGFEALLRWHHLRRGMVLPSKFIPVSEGVGLVVQIGEWAVRKARQCAVSWPEHLKVAVNISTVQFSNANLVRTVADALTESGLNSARLELEIAESVMIQDFDAAISVLRQLKKLGVSISMDDFGTGYSSLSYMRSFPFDEIKIDLSRRLARNPNRPPSLAPSAVCATAWESPVPRRGSRPNGNSFLLTESCTDIQGYLVSKPRPAHDSPNLIEQFTERGKRDLFETMSSRDQWRGLDRSPEF